MPGVWGQSQSSNAFCMCILNSVHQLSRLRKEGSYLAIVPCYIAKEENWYMTKLLYGNELRTQCYHLNTTCTCSVQWHSIQFFVYSHNWCDYQGFSIRAKPENLKKYKFLWQLCWLLHQNMDTKTVCASPKWSPPETILRPSLANSIALHVILGTVMRSSSLLVGRCQTRISW